MGRTKPSGNDASTAALVVCALALAAATLTPDPAVAQTDYYNLDKSRPLRVEDAYASERYAFELQLSPLTLSGSPDVLFYEPSLELKYGVLAGMELSAGVEGSVTRRDGNTDGRLGVIELSALYNLNSETLGIPALGIRVTGHVPVDDQENTSLELKGILTRVLGGSWRAHANGGWVFGEAGERWWTGVALDYVLPFRSLLLLGETYYAQPEEDGGDGRVRSAAGLRYQLGPRTGVDLGVGRDWSGADPVDWHVTVGLTTALAFRSLMP